MINFVNCNQGSVKKASICPYCGNESIPTASNLKGCCSWSCYEKLKESTATPNCKCSICEKAMYLKPSRIKRATNGITCSKECGYLLKAKYMSGEGNHQHGLKGELNASFIGDKRINQYGYVMLYLPNHPLSDKDGRYREHRYVVEQSNKFDSSYFTNIKGTKVLKDEFIPHHINGIKTDNRIDNLVILTRSEHTTHHNLEKEIIRDDENGRIIGVFKKGEFSESLEEDNTEPSIVNE